MLSCRYRNDSGIDTNFGTGECKGIDLFVVESDDFPGVRINLICDLYSNIASDALNVCILGRVGFDFSFFASCPRMHPHPFDSSVNQELRSVVCDPEEMWRMQQSKSLLSEA